MHAIISEFTVFVIYFILIEVLSQKSNYFQVRIEPGKTLKDALKKPMSLREIEPENCEVYDIRTK